MLRSPAMAEQGEAAARLPALRDVAAGGRLNEFAILIQARLWTAQLQWRAHHPLALSHGLAESVAADLRDGRRPRGMREDEEAVYDFCMEVVTTHRVSDATFDRARALLGERPLVDLIAVFGTYVTVAMLLNVSEAQLPSGEAPPLPPLPRG